MSAARAGIPTTLMTTPIQNCAWSMTTPATVTTATTSSIRLLQARSPVHTPRQPAWSAADILAVE